MNKKPGYLDELAVRFGVFISDLRIDPRLRGEAVELLSQQSVPANRLQEWQRALGYLRQEVLAA